MRLRLQQSLKDLKERLLVMGGMAEQAIQHSVEAYRVRDISICDLVDYEGHAIQRFEREIDQMALDLLAMEQPVANDLRFTLAVIKINTDLKRAGNAARSISHRVRDLQKLPVVALPVDIPRMALLATGMMRNALLAFIDADDALAQGVLSRDDTVDRLNDGAQFALSGLIERQPELVPQALSTMMIAHSLARIAHQSKKVASDVIFWVRGAGVRQHV